MFSNLMKEYIKPVCIVEKSDNVFGEDALFLNESKQVFLQEDRYMTCKGKGYIVLDFGKEMHGGLRLLAYWIDNGHHSLLNARVRFGESVGECCAEFGEKNAFCYHSVRDMYIRIPDLSDQEWGRTGFRFVRIDFLDDEEYRLVNIYAFATYRNLEFIGDFRCNDDLVNKIYDTARYTVFLNMQENLWEGIKRDRLVWVGDLYPEILAITDIFGADECVEDALETSIKKNPLPSWFGEIPTYSLWLIQIFYAYYMKVKNAEFVKKHLPYMEGVLQQLNECVTDDGLIDYTLADIPASNGYFVDWPTFETEDAKPGNRYIYIFVLNNMKKLYAELGMQVNPLCDVLLNKLYKVTTETASAKQIVSFGYLSGLISGEEAAQKLTEGGAKGLSTFMSYFILRAIAESKDVTSAVEIMKEYYGGMLSRGATTFWEDFDVDWLKDSGRIDEKTPFGKKDLHGDFGKYCYIGFRHSLCHGWSCGPVQFLTEKVLGIEVLSSGCDVISIKPDLGNLQFAEGKFPTPYGVVSIKATKNGGKTDVAISAPEQIKIIK